MKYQVWYMKPEWFRNGICGDEPDTLDLAKTHVHLKDVEAVKGELERIWVAMQGENWSPNCEAKPLLDEKGLHHTSMSMGDVLVEAESGDVYLAVSIGFKKIGNVEPSDTDGVPKEPEWSPCVTAIGTDHDGVEFD